MTDPIADGLFPDLAPPAAAAGVTLALARKYRPKTFAEVVGQDHVVRALTNALTQGRLHHAYLLTGTRGVGKTTLARIIAKALNCETGVTATPCGVCGACREIDAGRFVDLIEIDAASNTGVDNMRELIENAVYAPTAGRYKVYIIDEVHMLSKGAFNAMLKTLEEPPPHVKFVLATTDPQKIPVTVLSRCLQFGLKHIAPPVIAAQLAKVLTAEQVAFEPGALQVVARAASGSMRDSLSLLDQAIAFGGGQVAEAQVRDMIGLVDARWLHALLGALADGDGTALLAQADALAADGLDFETVLQSLASLLHRVAVAQTIPAALADDEPDRDAVLALAQRFDAEAVQLHYQIALRGRADLALAPDPFTGFSMTLLRMLAFRIDDDGGTPGGGARGGAARADTRGASGPAGGARGAAAPDRATPGAPAPTGSASAATAAALAPLPATPPVAAAAPAAPIAPPTSTSPAVARPTAERATAAPATIAASAPPGARSPDASATPASERASRLDAPSAPMAPVPAAAGTAPSAAGALPSSPSPTPSPARDVAARPTPGDWPDLVGRLRLSGMAQVLAEESALLRIDDDTLHLRVPDAHRHLVDSAARDKLVAALVAALGPVRVAIDAGALADDADTVALREARARDAAQAAARASIEHDPFVRAALDTFNARIRAGSIRPLAPDSRGDARP